MTNRVTIAISLPPDVAKRLDEWCKRKKLNRSQSVTMMVNSYMDAEEAKPVVVDMANGFNKFLTSFWTMTPEERERQMQMFNDEVQNLPESIRNE